MFSRSTDYDGAAGQLTFCMGGKAKFKDSDGFACISSWCSSDE